MKPFGIGTKITCINNTPMPVHSTCTAILGKTYTVLDEMVDDNNNYLIKIGNNLHTKLPNGKVLIGNWKKGTRFTLYNTKPQTIQEILNNIIKEIKTIITLINK